ncbi:cytochrome c biogenesis protein ResB [uncultured Agrococcus sp.]|uniref:cytochrome c biogenesis protein ResB n=1 Tax=uncultured Agrococcus sp. TaxID=382258 RepID=UPI0025E6C735|nr:cytochrome c biogenesis protein ResB [uncultured Agrococcus sp.]
MSRPSSEQQPPENRQLASSDDGASAGDPLRPDDHVDASPKKRTAPKNPELGFFGWLRWAWRQLTSMRTAILLLLLLALAAVPGSIVPQEMSNPNGVIQVREENPELLWLYDAFQLHHVFESYWFSAIYILLFVSLIGCIVPRIKHHLKALRTPPPKVPARLGRLPGFTVIEGDADDLDGAQKTLKKLGYRTRRTDAGVSAERGYLKETGNLVFHVLMVVLLVAVAVGNGWGFKGQRLVFEGYSYANTLSSWDLYQPGRFFDESDLPEYSFQLNDLDVEYETDNMDAFGMPTDFTGHVTITDRDGSYDDEIKVNAPLYVHGSYLFLLSNGYAPVITVEDEEGNVVFDEPVPFLAQDDQLTSLGVIKLPDGLEEQVGLRGFFYPTAAETETGALASAYPDLFQPVMTLEVYTGDLGLDEGVPRNVYMLDTEDMTQIAGRDAENETLVLAPGDSVDLPGGMGTVSLDGVVRYAVIDIQADPMNHVALVSAVALFGGLMLALLVPRRRVWVKATPKGLEIAGLARGEDPGLEKAVQDLAERLARERGPADPAGEEPDAEESASGEAQTEQQEHEPDAPEEKE